MSDTPKKIDLIEENIRLHKQLADIRHDRDTWQIRAKAAEQVCDEMHEKMKAMEESR